MKLNVLGLAAMVLLSAACGSHDDGKKEAPAQQATPDQPAAQDAAQGKPANAAQAPIDAPALLIVKVPVENGQEVPAKAMARQVSDVKEATSGEAAEAAFAQGKETQVSGELDRDSSAQQWGCGWYPGKLLGLWWGGNYGYGYGGYGYGYGGYGYGSNYGYGNYGYGNNYGYGYGNNGYYYNYAGNYGYGGYNYYLYGR